MEKCTKCGGCGPKYESTNWCESCVQSTLDEQRKLRFATQYPQVVEYDPEG